MSKAVFVGNNPKIRLDRIGGDLSVVGWDGAELLIKSDEDEARVGDRRVGEHAFDVVLHDRRDAGDHLVRRDRAETADRVPAHPEGSGRPDVVEQRRCGGGPELHGQHAAEDQGDRATSVSAAQDPEAS